MYKSILQFGETGIERIENAGSVHRQLKQEKSLLYENTYIFE